VPTAVAIVGWECSVVSGPGMTEMAVMVSSTVLAVEGAGAAVVMAGRVRVKVDGAVVVNREADWMELVQVAGGR
jgi:hypothetical protein